MEHLFVEHHPPRKTLAAVPFGVFELCPVQGKTVRMEGFIESRPTDGIVSILGILSHDRGVVVAKADYGPRKSVMKNSISDV